MSTETATADTTSTARIGKKVIGTLRHTGVFTLLGSFMIIYALGVVVLAEFFAEIGFWEEVGLIVKIGIETAAAVPVVASMVLSARYVLSILNIEVGDWEDGVLLAAGATWFFCPPLLAIWPELGLF